METETPSCCPNCREPRDPYDSFITETGVRHCGCYYENPRADIHFTRDPLRADKDLHNISLQISEAERVYLELKQLLADQATRIRDLQQTANTLSKRRLVFARVACDASLREKFDPNNPNSLIQ